MTKPQVKHFGSCLTKMKGTKVADEIVTGRVLEITQTSNIQLKTNIAPDGRIYIKDKRDTDRHLIANDMKNNILSNLQFTHAQKLYKYALTYIGQDQYMVFLDSGENSDKIKTRYFDNSATEVLKTFYKNHDLTDADKKSAFLFKSNAFGLLDVLEEKGLCIFRCVDTRERSDYLNKDRSKIPLVNIREIPISVTKMLSSEMKDLEREWLEKTEGIIMPPSIAKKIENFRQDMNDARNMLSEKDITNHNLEDIRQELILNFDKDTYIEFRNAQIIKPCILYDNHIKIDGEERLKIDLLESSGSSDEEF